MWVRKDLKNSALYDEILKKYKNKILKEFPLSIIGLFIGLAFLYIINIIFDLGNSIFAFILLYIIIAISLTVMLLYKLFISYRIVEMFIKDKKVIDGDEDPNIYKVKEDKKWFLVESENLYRKILINQNYLFLCRGCKIVAILEKEVF